LPPALLALFAGPDFCFPRKVIDSKGESAMASPAVAKAKVKSLPKSATIKIIDQAPVPSGEVEVMPDVGRVHFKNEDSKEYKIRLWRIGTEPHFGIELVLAPNGTITIAIRKDDEFSYTIMTKNGIMENGRGGGPIKN
jgi:hypothetical protein